MCSLFGGLFAVGTLLCLPLYRWQFKRFFRSTIWTKIIWWIPIFGVFIGVLMGGVWAAAIVVGLLEVRATIEFLHAKGRRRKLSLFYFLSVVVALVHLPYFFVLRPQTTVATLIVICFASVLSDVCAFFFGSYFGKHALPRWINPQKSWEGVGGQIVGALIGFTLVRLVVGIELSWWLALAIGGASALGDVMNSATKRQLDIKDWGRIIPGHGGILDRFSSLSYAIAISFWLGAVV